MKNFTKKILALVTVLTVSVMLVGPSVVQGETAADLQAQINALMAQLQTLQQQLAGQQTTPPSSYTACVGVTFSRNLKQGMSGSDVKCLQQVLNGDSTTQVAVSGAGSPGNETTYFGSRTFAAVVNFQVKYASEILTPIGLTAGTGFVGSLTRAKLNAMLTGVTPPPVTCGNGTCDAGESCSICPTDCGVCPVTCGNGTCDSGETCSTCSTDCGVCPTGTGLTVTLASDTPAAGTLVSGATIGQSLAPLAKFTFRNGNTTEAKVTTLKLKRLGVSADATLTNVYLFDGATRLTDSSSVSSGVITFNDSAGLFKVAAGGSKTITVSSDIAAGSNGQVVGVGITAATDVTTDAGSVNGTFPINGNLMGIALATLATVNFGATTSPTGATITPQNDYRVWENTTTVGERAVTLTRIALREIGTIAYADLQNFRLYVDGVAVGSSVANLDANGYLTFDLSAAPKRLETGARVIKVLADIIGGSSRTFTFSLRVAADANFVDSEYGVNVLPTANNLAFSARTSGIQAVSEGVITVTKTADSPSNVVVNGASNVLLGKFEVKATGEKVKVEWLRVAVDVGNNTSTTVKLRNGALYANDVQIGSTAAIYDLLNATAGYTQYNLGSSLIVVPGSPVTLTIKADAYDSETGGGNELMLTTTCTDTDWNTAGAGKVITVGSSTGMTAGEVLTTNNGGVGTITAVTNATTLAVTVTTASPATPTTVMRVDTIKVRIVGGALANAQGLVSSAVLNVPIADVDGNTLTNSLGGLTLAIYTAYVPMTFTPPLSPAKLAHFTLTANTSEAVNISAINVDIDTVTDAFLAASDLSNLYVTYGTNTTTIKPAVTATNNSWSINYQLAAGATIDVVVYANVAVDATNNDATADTGRADVTITGVTATSATSVTSGEASGQVISFSAGQLVSVVVPTTDQAVAGNQTVTAAKFKFTAQVDSYTITELKAKVANSTVSRAILQAVLKDAVTGTVLSTMPFSDAGNTTAKFTGLSVAIPANTPKTLAVDLMLSVPSADSNSAQVNAAITLDWIKYVSSTGTVGTDDTDRAGNALYVYRSIPTFTTVDVANPMVSNAEIEIYKFKVKAAANGDVSLKQLKFNLSWVDGDGIATSSLQLADLKLSRGSVPINSLVTIQDASGNEAEGTTTPLTVADSSFYVTFGTAALPAEEVIEAGQEYTYSLKATPSGFKSTANKTYDDGFAIALAGDDAFSGDGSGAGDRFLWDNPVGVGSIFQLATDNAGSGTSPYNVIWSDNSALWHSYASGNAYAYDWADGYLILDLPLTGESFRGP